MVLDWIPPSVKASLRVCMETALIIVYCLCGVVVLVVIFVVTMWCCCFRTDKKVALVQPAPVPTVSCTPPDGRSYPSPLVVHLRNNTQKPREIYVKVIHESQDQYDRYAALRGSNDPAAMADVSILNRSAQRREASARTARDEEQIGYMEYRSPLTLVEPGSYVIRAHTLRDGIADIQHFYFHIEAPHASVRMVPDNIERPLLAPPLIMPSSGEVTSSTHIKIIIEDETGCTGREMIKYSTDGTFPAVLYTGPFTVPVPHRANFHDCVIRAVVCAGDSASPEARAHLRVLPGSALLFDPTIPAPTAQVDAVGALLYFEPPEAPNSEVHFRVEFIKDRHGGYIDMDAAGSETQVYRNEPFLISADVARILAWTVPTTADGMKRSEASVYDVSLQKLTRNSKIRRGRLSPPVICVTCNDLYLTFDDPPSAFVLLYTLDGTEPAIGDDSHSTHRFAAGSKPIDVSKCEYKTLMVTARYFTPNALAAETATNREQRLGGDEVVRFGEKFSRGFHFEE